MTQLPEYIIRPIGRVESPIVDLSAAPRQGDEGAPLAWLVFDPAVADGLRDIAQDAALLVLTRLARANRDVLMVHPRGDVTRPQQVVFSTRSPHRPNLSVCTWSPWSRWTASGFRCETWKPSMARPSSTSSRCSAPSPNADFYPRSWSIMS